MAISEPLVEFLGFFLEPLAPFMPGHTFPAFFELQMFHRALIAAFLVTIVAGSVSYTHLTLPTKA